MANDGSIHTYRSEVDKIIRFGGSSKETSIRRAVFNLINAYARSRDLLLVEELDYFNLPHVSGNQARPAHQSARVHESAFGHGAAGADGSHILRKLEISGTPKLVAYAIKHGFTPPSPAASCAIIEV